MTFDKTVVWKITTVVLAVAAVISYGLPVKVGHMEMGDSPLQVVKPVLADEIYPRFTCSCCGQPLNKEEPCCGIMEGMIDFIDSQVSSGMSEDEVVMAMVKEYGIERLTNESDRLALKAKLIEDAPVDAPRIVLDEVERDLGTVSQANGTVHSDFELRNEGESPLVIDKLSSSCGCTSAAVAYKGEEGPRFYMAGHGHDNPTDWEVSVAPGEKAVLRVYYDPTVHKDLMGDVTRTVSVFSNDPVEFEKQVTITLEQVK